MMDKFVLVPQEQFIRMQDKINHDISGGEKSKENIITQETNIDTLKQIEPFNQDTQIIVGGAEDRLPPPGIPNKKRKRIIKFKSSKSNSWKQIWQKL